MHHTYEEVAFLEVLVRYGEECHHLGHLLVAFDPWSHPDFKSFGSSPPSCYCYFEGSELPNRPDHTGAGEELPPSSRRISTKT